MAIFIFQDKSNRLDKLTTEGLLSSIKILISNPVASDIYYIVIKLKKNIES